MAYQILTFLSSMSCWIFINPVTCFFAIQVASKSFKKIKGETGYWSRALLGSVEPTCKNILGTSLATCETVRFVIFYLFLTIALLCLKFLVWVVVTQQVLAHYVITRLLATMSIVHLSKTRNFERFRINVENSAHFFNS